jgi:hypothetical protein
VQHVIEAPIARSTLEDIQSGQLACFLDPQTALDQELQNGPVPKGTSFRGPNMTIRIYAKRLRRFLPTLASEGTHFRHFSLEFKNCIGNS